MRAILVFVASCHFSPGDALAVDAPPTPGIDAPLACAPGMPVCADAVLGTCNARGDGIDADPIACTLGCIADPTPHCTAASNLAEADQVACLQTPGPDLDRTSGSVSISGTGAITCNPNCGTLQPRGTVSQVGGPTLSWYCVGALHWGAGVELDVSPNHTNGILIFATGAVTIDGEIRIDGEDAPMASHGRGGPGGTQGADLGLVDGNGLPAPGTCGGTGGAAGVAPSQDGGGGGGGGHNGAGGTGGDARSDVGATVAGAVGSASGCGAAALAPLTGGAGGGGGGDGNCGGTGRCGFGGGGGGGAIQIAARGGVIVNGTIRARGGAGFGNPGSITLIHGGAGGGGAGGGILLESWRVTLGATSLLDVGGGGGGSSGAGTGGQSQTTTTAGGDGTDATVDNTGGAGGGGGAGVVRVNGGSTDGCTRALPTGACTTGAPPASQLSKPSP